jgi:hypothetical protein
MDVFKSSHQTRNKKSYPLVTLKFTSLLFCESPVSANVVPQITPVQKVHDQVQVLSILEGIVHVDNERIVKLRQDLALIHDRLDATLRYNSCL